MAIAFLVIQPVNCDCVRSEYADRGLHDPRVSDLLAAASINSPETPSSHSCCKRGNGGGIRQVSRRGLDILQRSVQRGCGKRGCSGPVSQIGAHLDLRTRTCRRSRTSP